MDIRSISVSVLEAGPWNASTTYTGSGTRHPFSLNCFSLERHLRNGHIQIEESSWLSAGPPHQSKTQINPVCTLLFGDILKGQTGCDILKATTWRFWAFPVSLNCLGARTVSLDPYMEIPALFCCENEFYNMTSMRSFLLSNQWECTLAVIELVTECFPTSFLQCVCEWSCMIIHIEWWHGLNIFIPRVKL